jgi:hypothetical protein
MNFNWLRNGFIGVKEVAYGFPHLERLELEYFFNLCEGHTHVWDKEYKFNADTKEGFHQLRSIFFIRVIGEIILTKDAI